MEQAFEELKSRIEALEAKVAALPSPQEFASIKSDIELLKSDAAPRATSTAEAALKVAYGMKEELAQNGESIDRLREEITTLKRSEAVAQPGLVPQVRQNVIKWLVSTEVDRFNPKVLFRLSSNDVYANLGSTQSWLSVYRPEFAVVEILLKEPVQVNGLTFVSSPDRFPKKAQIVLGGQRYGSPHQVNIQDPKKEKDRTNSVRSEFSARMVSWVRLLQQDGARNGNQCFVFNLELHSPDPEYTDGVFTTLRRKNSNLRYACNVSARKLPRPANGVVFAYFGRKFGTYYEKQPWLEVEIVEGRLKATGYTIVAKPDHTNTWTFRGSNDRNVPIDKWTILHQYDGGGADVQVIYHQKATFPCIASEPMKYFRMIADPLPTANSTVDLHMFDIHGVLCS